MATVVMHKTSPSVATGEHLHDLGSATHRLDQSPYSLDINAHSQQQQQQQQQHQPMYRKKETKPGQKDKRVLKKTPNSPSSRKKHGTNSKNENVAPKDDKAKPAPSSKKPQNKNNPKKKSKKSNNKPKKKQSKLAFWFCMSSNTDAQDRSSQAPVSKPPNPKPSIERQQDSLDRDMTLETPIEILATKHSRRNASKRHSAPPSSEWSRIVTTAIVESPSQPPRSRTPTGGVRYRYDGTLERPYVYPGGLTFQSGDKSWRQDAGKRHSSFCDTTMEDGSQFGQCDKYDDFDITSKFYLRFDHDLRDDSNSKDKRLSMLSSFIDGERKDPGHKLHSPASETNRSHSFANSALDDNYSPNQNVIYDIPYESDSDEEDKNEDGDGKRNSYYSKPLQNSSCIYMWHSCEDLQHCEEKYHSKDGINRICKICNANTPPRSNRDIHTGYGNGGDDISVSSSPTTTACPNTNTISYARKMSLPAELTLEYPLSGSIQIKDNSGQQMHVSRDDTRNSHTPEETDIKEALLVKDSVDSSQTMTTQSEVSKFSDQSKQFDSPFRRDIGRSSCMPGNKRFFIPPPPAYTPPKEEMEVTLATINKVNCHRGSQTDLMEDVDEVDMEDRDLSLKRQELKNQNSLRSQMVKLSLNTEVKKAVSIDKHSNEDRGRDCKFQNVTPSPLIVHEPPKYSQDTLTHSEPNQTSKPAPNVRTSTPKPSRRSSQQDGDLKVFSGPKPLPRKRIPSKDLTPSISTVEGDVVQLSESESGNQMADSLPCTVVRRTNKVPPVPKKRRSQMVEADLTYTSADIEKVLAECKDDTLPRGSSDPNAGIRNVKENNPSHESQNTRGVGETQTIELDLSGIRKDFVKPSYSPTQSTPSKDNPNQINRSPEHRCRLNSSFGSSLDGGYPPRKFTPLSPSLDNMVNIFQEMTYDPDNEDNCNADDEMSIHNEDIFPPGSTSVQNLLRSRSIFDRSLAVTRKRRQRLRDRKCHSQLLSSVDIDEYDKKMSKSHHLWKLQKHDGHEKRVPGFHLPNGGQPFLKPHLLMEKNLWKHSYTDSGNDSDMLSPNDVRDNRHVEDVFQESYSPPEMWKRAGNRDVDKVTPEKKPWELRLRVKHELRKARSIEHLFLAQDVHTTKKPSLETCV